MTAADRPSVTDNARAEAWRRFPNGIDVETGEPVDDYGYPETAREAVPQLIATVREQAAKLARVEALHQPSPEQVDDAGVAYRLCLHCTYINRYGRQRYPCPTITALNEGATARTHPTRDDVSVIAQKVAAEHRQTSHRDRRLACSCTWVADHYRDSDLGPFAQWARHIATQAARTARGEDK